jgi:26S proteasome regulatory subunit N11
LIHGLNRYYYSMPISYRKNELEQKMLLNVHKKTWTHGLSLEKFEEHDKQNEMTIQNMVELAKSYNKMIKEESKVERKKLEIQNVGKLDAKRHLEQDVEKLMSGNINQMLGMILNTVIF